MVDWATFANALTKRGTTFERVRLASNRVAVLHAMGFTDPLDVAVLETEWESRARRGGINSGGDSSASEVTRHAAASPDFAGTPTAANLAAASSSRLQRPLYAFDAASLKAAPEDIQEAVVADELVHVLRGHGGALISIGDDGRASVSPHMPRSMASLIAGLLEVTWAQRVLTAVERLELLDFPGRSKVKNAVAEAVREAHTQYTKDICDLGDRYRSKPLPLARVVAEGHIISHPLQRIATTFEEIAARRRTSIDDMTGDVLLAELHDSYMRVAGNVDDERVLGFILRRASRPYIAIMNDWMYTGNLDDPFHEFFVSSSDQPPKPGDALSTFMDAFATVRKRVPKYLEATYKQVFHAGRFCRLIKDSNGQLPDRCDVTDFVWGDTDGVESAVRYVYEASSKEVMRVLIDQSRLVERFTSLKDYFLHARGDWLENFLEASNEMLSRTTGQVKTYTLNVVLQSEISKACLHDKYRGSIRFALSDYTLPELIKRIRQADPDMRQVVATTETVRHSVRRSGLHVVGTAAAARQDKRQILEHMQLQVDAEWPLALIINPAFVVKLNIIFRLLLWCKLSERDLNEAWWRNSDSLPRATLLRLKLLQFVRQYFFYAVHHVLDPAWHAMMTRIAEAAGFREISSSVATFCDDAFRGLAIKSEHAFKALSAILGLCQKFSELGRHHNTGELDDVARRTAINAKVRQYDTEFNSMLQALGDPAKKDYGKVVPLLAWLDFSGYYDRQGIYRIRHGAAAHDEAAQAAAAGGRRSNSIDDAETASATTVAGRGASTSSLA